MPIDISMQDKSLADMEVCENHPRILYLKAQIKALDAALEKTKQDRDKWKDEANRWFERYTGRRCSRSWRLRKPRIGA